MEPLATVGDLGDFLGTSFDGNDARASRALESASALIRGEAGQDFVLIEDETVLLDGTGARNLLLPSFPVSAVSALSENEASLVEGTDFSLAAGSGILQRLGGGGWAIGLGNISCTFSHGFAEVPSEIEALAVEVAARAYTNPTYLDDEIVGDWRGKDARAAPLTPFEKALLRRYQETAAEM